MPKNLLCSNEKEARRGATLCRNQVPGLPRDDQPDDVETMLTKLAPGRKYLNWGPYL